MRVKPTEVKLIASELDAAFTAVGEGGELELQDLARGLIEKLDAKREADDDLFAAVCYLPTSSAGGTWIGLGPFPTRLSAQRAALRVAAPGPQPGVGRVVRLQRDVPT